MNFLVDAQLPPLLSEWIEKRTGYRARHVSKLKNGLTSTDSYIWDIALKTNEIIITKDFDFLDRSLVSDRAPLVLHINLGNCSNRQLLRFLNKNWSQIIDIFEKDHTIISCSFGEMEYW